MRILIIEDNAVLSLTLEVMLRRMGFSCIEKAFNACEAMQQVNDFDPELLLVDINLDSEITSIDVVKSVQESRPDIKVIYTTANSDIYHKKLAGETEYIGCLSKPLNYNELSSTIDTLAVSKTG